MKLFVWVQVDPVSSNYHSEGGLMIVAEDLGAAREAMRAYVARWAKRPLPDDDLEWLVEAPDREFVVSAATPAEIIVFPDAGCC